jgi:ferredoxin
MLEVLDRLCGGQGKPEDIGKLEDLGHLIKRASLCGLGRTAPNPVLSALKYFRPEYEAHLAGQCPAGVCQALIRYSITTRCIGCTLCAQRCPAKAISPVPYQRHIIDQRLCVRCGTCRRVCPSAAVEVR